MSRRQPKTGKEKTRLSIFCHEVSLKRTILELTFRVKELYVTHIPFRKTYAAIKARELVYLSEL